MLFVCHSKFCINIVFSFSRGHFNSQEELKTMLMQKFWSDKQRVLWYVMVFLERSIVILSWWPIIILFYHHHVYIIICLLHGEELCINLSISNFKFSVTFFPQIFNSYASICAPLAQKGTFYQATVEHTIILLNSHKPQQY